MQTIQDTGSSAKNLPETIANIIRKNPSFWQGEEEPTVSDKVNNQTYSEQAKQENAIDSSPVSEKTPITDKTASDNGQDDETRLSDNDDDYFISKPVNSAFEINIAEFPIAYLNSGKLPDGVSKTKYTYNDTIKGRDGKPVQRTWTIEAHATQDVINENGNKDVVQLGFGGPSTLEVIYELFQLWKEQGFMEPKIHVGSFYNLLKRLDWGTGSTQYKQLRKVLSCLHGLHIKGEQCFYIPEIDHYQNVDFYPFPRINTYTKQEKQIRPDDYVFVSVDQEFFNAVKANTIYYIPFDRFYFKKLKPMEQKLALMLSKIFSPYRKQQRFEWRRNIFELANQIPILSDESKVIRLQLKRICDGLLKKKFPFLSSYKITNDVVTFYNNLQTSMQLQPEANSADKKDHDTVEWLINEQLKICGDQHSRAFYALIAKRVPVDIIYEALSEARQEGKSKAKLYTKIIKEKAKKYLEKYLKKTTGEEDVIVIPEEDKKNIELELLKEKDEFAKRKAAAEISEIEISEEEMNEEQNNQIELVSERDQIINSGIEEAIKKYVHLLDRNWYARDSETIISIAVDIEGMKHEYQEFWDRFIDAEKEYYKRTLKKHHAEMEIP